MERETPQGMGSEWENWEPDPDEEEPTEKKDLPKPVGLVDENGRIEGTIYRFKKPISGGVAVSRNPEDVKRVIELPEVPTIKDKIGNRITTSRPAIRIREIYDKLKR